MRWISAMTILSLPLTGSVTACATGHDSPSARTVTYALAPQTARPDERAVRLPPVTDGDTTCTVIGLTSGMPQLVGSHADAAARGQYVRIRIEMVNNGRTTAVIDVTREQLVTADGQAHDPDRDAMLIKRQPLSLDLGAAMRAEFDLWYDVPRGARLSALRVHGGATLTDMKDVQATDLKLG